MVQEFYINSTATLPVLRMELINDGRNDYNKVYDAIQDADITFSMKDTETGMLKICNEEAFVKLADTNGCEEKYVIEYDWKERDTRKPGIYKGWFDIHFRGELREPSSEYCLGSPDNIIERFPNGRLIVPIQEDLIIYVK